jgi:hypothetical protein
MPVSTGIVTIDSDLVPPGAVPVCNPRVPAVPPSKPVPFSPPLPPEAPGVPPKPFVPEAPLPPFEAGS